MTADEELMAKGIELAIAHAQLSLLIQISNGTRYKDRKEDNKIADSEEIRARAEYFMREIRRPIPKL